MTHPPVQTFKIQRPQVEIILLLKLTVTNSFLEAAHEEMRKNIILEKYLSAFL